MADVEAVLDAYAGRASTVLNGQMKSERCLNGTRICMLALRPLGLKVEPMSVKAVAMNASFRLRFEDRNRVPLTDAEAEEWHRAGAWAVATDDGGHWVRDPEDIDWPGHLVAVVNNRWLVDTAACGFHRPQHGIEVPEVLWTRITGKWRKGSTDLHIQLDAGGRMIYRARPKDRSYKSLPGFQCSLHNKMAAEEIRLGVVS